MSCNVDEVTERLDINEEIKHRINMGNACYYSLEKTLFPRNKVRLIQIKLLYYQSHCVVVKLGISP